ncbi:MAG: class I SAM-dependent methyltransferase [Nitrospirae bacterium]|nr:class I SAM-dependent methyltransferase [Nitrospirota bacterium]
MSEIDRMLKINRNNISRVEKTGQDLWIESDSNIEYSDVGTEQESKILDELKRTSWRNVVAQRFEQKSPWLYRIITDKGRSLFLDVLPIKKDGCFLDVGSGWGQVAIPLSRYGKVYCMDVTQTRLNILREIAKQENSGLNYICGNFCTFPFDDEQFDLVIFNGTFEWLPLGAPQKGNKEAQEAALEKTCRILNPDGIVYIGIENSLGLKYIMGAPDDHTGIQHITFLNESDADAAYKKVTGKKSLRVRTWSLAEYTQMLVEAGFVILETYACFPDYKLIRQMIPIQEVNSYILGNGVCAPEYSGVDGAHLPFIGKMDSIYRLLAKNGVAQLFCPSYSFVAKKPK